MPDLARWAQVIAHFLRSAAFTSSTFTDDGRFEPDGDDLAVTHPYSRPASRSDLTNDGSYADRTASVQNRDDVHLDASDQRAVTALLSMPGWVSILARVSFHR